MYAAQELAKYVHAAVKPMLKEENRCLEGVIGIVFPVYVNSLPKPVEAFIKRMEFRQVTYLYCIMTHAGMPGKPEGYLNMLLHRKNSRLDEFFSLKMISNTPKGIAPKFLMKMNWETEITKDKVDKMVQNTNEAIRQIAEAVNNRLAVFKEEVENGKRKDSMMNQLLWKMSASPKLVFYSDDTCNGCGICEKVCLSGRIRVDKKPVWTKEECYYCYACFNYCPKQAISVKYYEKKQGRYHFPTIDAEQIAGQKVKSLRFFDTDGKNEEFVYLCGKLDENLDEIVGGRFQRQQYVKYNTLEKIQDVIVVYDKERPIGCGAFRFYDERTAEIKRLYLLPEYRGRGIAGELLKRLEANAKNKGFSTVVLETGEPLTEAMALYKRAGYQVVPNYGAYADMPDSVCMSKKL